MGRFSVSERYLERWESSVYCSSTLALTKLLEFHARMLKWGAAPKGSHLHPQPSRAWYFSQGYRLYGVWPPVIGASDIIIMEGMLQILVSLCGRKRGTHPVRFATYSSNVPMKHYEAFKLNARK